jgi:CPA2 family monovalent cation:H+ antiporter-2
MEHLPGLIYDLALILITGAVTTILFKSIKQPVVLGYIIAGILIGPHLTFLPTVSDRENIEIWAKIGVIFLLFSLGLEFSFRKLKHIGGSASVTAVVEIFFIMLSGYLLGVTMGWSVMDSIFLGGMLASSSTTIISKAFDELGIKTQSFAGVVIGVLIVEDLIVILLMVLLSTLSATHNFEGKDVILTILKLSFFIVLWFVAGIFLIPTLMRKAREMLSEETLLILSVGLCLGMVVLATGVGFSAELGAFIMGSILAETTSAEKIEHLIKPVKDLFGAIFFVSVGMLIDPKILIEYKWPILWITLLVLVGKFLSTSAGALISGQSLKQSVQVGMSMAQVGEFAFIVASLGLSLRVTSDFLFPVAVGVSAVTTFTTPYMIKYTPDFYEKVIRVLPREWVKALNRYSSGTQDIQVESNWKKILKGYLNIVVTNAIIVMAIFLLSVEFLYPFIEEHFQGLLAPDISVLVVSLVAASPFLGALMLKRINQDVYRELWIGRPYSRGPLFLLEISRVIVGILLTGFLLDKIFSTKTAFIIGLPVIIIATMFASRRTKYFYRKIEARFLDNLKGRQVDEPFPKVFRGTLNKQQGLAPWDVHLVDLEVSPDALFPGKKLCELAWREKYGINIIYIKRGERILFAPGKNDCLYPYDHAGIIGTDSQMQLFKPVFDQKPGNADEWHNTEEISIERIVIHEDSPLNGRTISESCLRDLTNGIVIGIQRNSERILNPGSDVKFEQDDIVWIAGETRKIGKYLLNT